MHLTAVSHVGQNSSAHVARVVGLQTDAVVVTETRLKSGITDYFIATEDIC